jgi:PPK2 family polyphosphate:nucleotide phosphotransferase
MSQPQMRERLRFAPTERLVERLTDDHPGRPKKAKKKELAADAQAIASLQERLWAESRTGGKRSVLLVLQGIDTAGKGGVTAHVVGACGPIGVQYSGFAKPTSEELAHDFLWRIRAKLPPAGVIGVFDRSHYEDVLVARVHELVGPEELDRRYEAINDFERELAKDGTTIVKVLLHISFDTQRERLLARLSDPDKHWKFQEADIEERARWTEYQAAFQVMLERCNTAAAPWYVVPSDNKKYRNWAVAELLYETLTELDPHYPRPALDLDALVARLQPPH